jgi:hypothetical protein
MSALWPGKAKLVATLKEAVAAFKEAGGRLDFVPGVSGGRPGNRWLKTPTQPALLRENIANESEGRDGISNGTLNKQKSGGNTGKRSTAREKISTESSRILRKKGKQPTRKRPCGLKTSNGLSRENGRKSAKVSNGSSRIV